MLTSGMTAERSERSLLLLIRGVSVLLAVLVGVLIWKVATGRIQVREPTCADYADVPRGKVPARCFKDFDPGRP